MEANKSPAEPMNVTVVVPMHNAEATVLRCLTSIAAQTQTAANVIVVDDASTDTSVEVVERARMPRVELIRLPRNTGPGAARNSGVSKAQTPWVAFLDADNEWAPEFLAEMTAALRSTHADFGSSGGTRLKVYPASYRSVRLLPGPPIAADRSRDFWRISLSFIPSVPSSTIVRRTLFLRVGGFPEDMRTGEDVCLAARLWLTGQFVFVNQLLYTSYQLPSGLSAGARSYHDVRLLLARVGRTLVQAIRLRRPGVAWFLVAYARMFVGRHVDWLTRAAGRSAPASSQAVEKRS